MAKHKFTPAERHAVFSVHGLKCYIGHEPLDYVTAEIDHVIPESLIDKPDELAEVLEQLALPPEFDLNSYENWLPACRTCNGKKSDAPWDPIPLVHRELTRARAKANEASAVAARLVHQQTLTKALSTVAVAHGNGQLAPSDLETLAPLIEDFLSARPKAEAEGLVQVAPAVAFQVSNGRIVVVDGPFGRGAGPASPSDAMRCGVCGSQYFNGARCVLCGNLDDD